MDDAGDVAGCIECFAEQGEMDPSGTTTGDTPQ